MVYSFHTSFYHFSLFISILFFVAIVGFSCPFYLLTGYYLCIWILLISGYFLLRRWILIAWVTLIIASLRCTVLSPVYRNCIPFFSNVYASHYLSYLIAFINISRTRWNSSITVSLVDMLSALLYYLLWIYKDVHLYVNLAMDMPFKECSPSLSLKYL